MFLLNGKPLPNDTPFEDDLGNKYPANWLRLTTAEEKAAMGITEVPDPVVEITVTEPQVELPLETPNV